LISENDWVHLTKEVKNCDSYINQFLKKNRPVIEAANKIISGGEDAIDAIDLKEKLEKIKSLDELKSFINENYIQKDIKSLFYQYEDLIESLGEGQGKVIQFKISGDKILVDKNKYNGFVNISVHLFRNMVDHGIESENERAEKAKSKSGSIKMDFKTHDSTFSIHLSDNGRGIDPQIIKEMSIAKGLKTEEELRGSTQRELIELIFLPGFSTKEEVTDISGRGIGMDAVKAEVELLGGTISVTSEIDIGTEFIIELPIIK